MLVPKVQLLPTRDPGDIGSSQVGQQVGTVEGMCPTQGEAAAGCALSNAADILPWFSMYRRHSHSERVC